jgi:hypothetical protein
MWYIHLTTELLKKISDAAEPDELLRFFIDHIRRSVHGERALFLNIAEVNLRRADHEP